MRGCRRSGRGTCPRACACARTDARAPTRAHRRARRRAPGVRPSPKCACVRAYAHTQAHATDAHAARTPRQQTARCPMLARRRDGWACWCTRPRRPAPGGRTRGQPLRGSEGTCTWASTAGLEGRGGRGERGRRACRVHAARHVSGAGMPGHTRLGMPAHMRLGATHFSDMRPFLGTASSSLLGSYLPRVEMPAGTDTTAAESNSGCDGSRASAAAAWPIRPSS